MKNLFKFFALLFAMGILVVACDDVKLDEPQIDEEISKDNAFASKNVGDVFAAVNNGRINASGKAAGECPNVKYTSVNRTLTLTYDGCEGIDGVTRDGVITAVFDGDTWGEEGNKITITFTNYKVNGNELTGEINATHMGYDNSQNPIFNVRSNGNLTLVFEDERQLVWSFNTDFTWISGWDTPLIKTDDAWRVNGTSSGTGRSGKTFVRTDTNLETSPTCPWYVSGTINLTINESDELLMEFTACGTVTFTYKGITVTKTLQ